jgi:hypothetical protein
MRIDVDTDAPIKIEATLKKSTREFEVWRRTHLIRKVKKTSGVSDLNFATTVNYFDAAKLLIKDDSGSVVIYPSGEWNTNVASAMSGWSEWEKLTVDSTVNQYTSGNNGLHVRTRAQFRSAFAALYNGATPTEVNTWMTNNNLDTDVKYSNFMQDKAIEVIKSVFNHKFRNDTEGSNIFQVHFSHNLLAAAFASGGSITDGMAANFPAASRNHCAFLSNLDGAGFISLGFTADRADRTAAHEFGHHFFLPHPAPVNGESGYSAHDTAVTNCVMSYADGTRVFCGLCQLRLRGWDKSALSTTSATNTKT